MPGVAAAGPVRPSLPPTMATPGLQPEPGGRDGDGRPPTRTARPPAQALGRAPAVNAHALAWLRASSSDCAVADAAAGPGGSCRSHLHCMHAMQRWGGWSTASHRTPTRFYIHVKMKSVETQAALVVCQTNQTSDCQSVTTQSRSAHMACPDPTKPKTRPAKKGPGFCGSPSPSRRLCVLEIGLGLTSTSTTAMHREQTCVDQKAARQKGHKKKAAAAVQGAQAPRHPRPIGSPRHVSMLPRATLSGGHPPDEHDCTSAY